MAKSNSKRKTRPDKFPLTLHKTGQYCKKIKGKLYYFGSDKKKTLQRYLDQAIDLHAGRTPKPDSAGANIAIFALCNLYQAGFDAVDIKACHGYRLTLGQAVFSEV